MRKVFGRYEVLAPIASGGMATVHLARAVGVGGFERLIAIKVMPPDVAHDSSFVAMFLDEARLAARVRHPNIVGTIDVQESDDGLFIVMEYVEGPSVTALLKELDKKDKPLPIPMTLRVMIDALIGLHAAHEQTGPGGEPLNIVHRDISPQNILVGIDGHAKITDFGVASAEARLASTQDGSVKGKVAYMSPQQIRAERVDRRADVYAAGIVLWEMLTQQRLFTADNPGAIIYAAMNGAPQSPCQVNPAIPQSIDEACMRALKIEVAERYPTALEFAQALERAAHESGVAIASTWDLGAFVKALGAHKPPPTIETIAAEDLVTLSTPLAPPEPATVVRPSSPTGNAAQKGDSNITAITSSGPAHPAKSSYLGFVALGVVITVVMGVVARMMWPGSSNGTHDASANTLPSAPGSVAVPSPVVSSTPLETLPKPSSSANVEMAAPGPTAGTAKVSVPAVRTTAPIKTPTKKKDDWKPEGL